VELSYEEVRKIAELAKLDLTDEEVKLYAGQLSHVLEYFKRLQELDTTRIPPTASVLPLTNVMRADEALPALAPDDVIANAPDSDNYQFRVNAVFGEE
jgi:aspartyl-tRNA(Asn)/glutamyl-tRNA(Gln) amidotransferase subunit C